jgi:hypothetical protein
MQRRRLEEIKPYFRRSSKYALGTGFDPDSDPDPDGFRFALFSKQTNQIS